MTFGPGKGDKPTFGYDKTKFPDYVCLEGADNDRALVMCRVPWIDEDVTLEGEEDWMYNGEKQMSLVLGIPIRSPLSKVDLTLSLSIMII